MSVMTNKRAAAFVFALAIIFAHGLTTFANDHNGIDLVPVREMLEAHGMEVEWRNDVGQQQIWAQRGDFAIDMRLGSYHITFGNFARWYEAVQIEMQAPPMLVNGRAFAPADAILRALNTYQFSNTIYFGGITWRVLAIEEDKKLLLSQYVLEQRAFNEAHEHVSWETSTIRQYLNNDFYGRFTLDEQARIAVTRLENSGNPWFQAGRAGNDSYDKIFLLSLDEVLRYFGDSGGIQSWTTAQWTFNNALTDRYSDLRIANAHDQHGEAAMWWLRTPGFNRDVVTGIRPSGDIYMDGAIVTVPLGIRPALWLYIQ